MTIEEFLVTLIFAINFVANVYAYFDGKKYNHSYNDFPIKRMILLSFLGLLVVLFY